ncbi:hypothetical protein GWK47_016311 [Chionoecetes opilio]|uniref:HAT C-terminal dimerisation domain-containing protein n=1 Tax=Chionoecetes opilio TaxID=41210 RepID=A0A8J4XUI2_CHIOP|nr:hypothetical protein GWK47_016311 [Chionoecetes opilio]
MGPNFADPSPPFWGSFIFWHPQDWSLVTLSNKFQHFLCYRHAATRRVVKRLKRGGLRAGAAFTTRPSPITTHNKLTTRSCKQCELDGDVDEELEKNLHSWTQLGVQDNVPLSPDMFPMEHRQTWVDLFIRYNTPVPSSAAVERLFSMGSDVMRPKRSSLTAKNLEKLVFLKGNMNLLKGRWELEDSDEDD